ncbi:MAG: hypothetical protein EHM42_15745, partial [Planctomycetaceae bacterium]
MTEKPNHLDPQETSLGSDSSDSVQQTTVPVGEPIANPTPCEGSFAIGEGDTSVLETLSQTLDCVPHVVLRGATEQRSRPALRSAAQGVPNRSAGGRYELHGEIARGGMGAILLGRDTDLGRDLAVKVLLDSHKHNREVVQRF